MAAPIFKVTIMPDSDYLIPMGTSKQAKPGSHYYNRQVSSITHRAGEDLARHARQKVYDLLKQGGKQDIGVTGKAAHNVTVEEGRHSDGHTTWDVIEGDLTMANQMMRKGLKGRPVNFGSGASYEGDTRSNTIIRALQKWAIMRKVPLRDPHGATTRKVGYIKSRLLTEKRDRPPRPYKKDIGTFGRAIKAIYWALMMEGTFRPTSHWFGKHPSGYGRYDYVSHVFSSERQFTRIKGEVAQDAYAAIVQWLLSGRIKAKETGGYGERYFY